MRDRLAAHGRNNSEAHEMSQVVNGAGGGGSTVQNFLSEITSIQSSISQLDSNIRTISTLHSRSLNTGTDGGESKAALASTLDNLITETRSLTTSIKQRIQTLGDETKDLAKNGKVQQTDLDLRRDHLSRIRSRFMESIQEYQRVEQDFNSKSRERAARQYKIVKPDATPEEIKELVSNGVESQGIFAEATLASSTRYAESRTAYREVQERQEDIKKIEKTLAELAQMYQDMSIIIQQQDESITQAENNAIEVEKNVEKGLEETEIAVKHARRARRMRIMLFWIAVFIIVVLALVLGLALGLKN
ncbi:hypothetical protein VKT23_010180 [Stygiomarasmius scandens]|uniref:t-SNARE coiled-coil homology domain-containing protein n=1 Tax=Marasmiellus scandens TaxID=2682957 RepID=A0ABR1JI23_9AGAR